MQSKKTILVLGIILAVISSCSTVNKTTSNPQPDLLTGQWTMTKWKDVVDLNLAFPTGVPSFKIDAEQGSISGFNGCNQINGKLRNTRETASLQFYSLISTRMFCNTVPELELTNAITRINKYTVSNDSLILLIDNEVVMEFERNE
jgi:heat shock protein HslJ